MTGDANLPKAVAVRSLDGSKWAAVAGLFPEFQQRRAAALTVLLSQQTESLGRRRQEAGQLLVTPSLLLMPPHVAQRCWISATVAGRDGIPGMGSFARALAEPRTPDTQLVRRARAGAAIQALVTARVGGRFWAPPLPVEQTMTLVCIGAGADLAGCSSALAAALAAGPADGIVIFADTAPPGWIVQARRLGITVFTQPHDPWSAIDRADHIHGAGNHEVILLAALAGRAVYHHAAADGALPWYADAEPRDAAAAWIEGSRHIDPYSGRAATCEDSIALLGGWRPVLAANRRIACCVGMSAWKRRRMAEFFHDGTRAPAFVRSTGAALRVARRRQGAVAAWNSRIPAGLADAATDAGVALLRVEDGFVRSVGLGSDFLPPCSIIADGRGIYYDPRQASDLEHLLAHAEIDSALRARAAQLIIALRRAGVTKYGAAATGATNASPPLPIDRKAGQRVLLVPGQVADDLSVRLGGAGVRSNLALLRVVRASNPQALILYKPHPDVAAGHRAGAVPEPDMRRFADGIVRGGAMSQLIDSVDEVHTMTSLAGFEALLRGRAVTVYGQPFYAGWGLTHDVAPLARRTRRLSLEELAAAVLILYPRYLDPATSLPCGPELLITRLAEPALWRPGWLMRARQMQGVLRKRWRRGTQTAGSDVAEIG